MKRVAILGATGSIGRQTLEVIEADRDRFEVVALAAGRNGDLLRELSMQFRPRLVSIADERQAVALSRALKPHGIEVAAGPEGAVAAAEVPADIVVAAMVGSAGLRPTLAALAAGRTVALANKETLVTAGHLVMAAGGRELLLPVDSEHSAVFQCLAGSRPGELARIWLTGSGGPFWTWDPDRIANASVADALRHPRWQMGAKITVDSATMVNKGLELIEAHWLFGVGWDQLSVTIHPESIVHSLVEFVDGSFLAQMSPPDMRLAIAYALHYPQREPQPWPRLGLPGPLSLTFLPPDEMKFPGLALARECGMAGGLAPTVLNAANEEAVSQFLEGSIPFGDIVRLTERVVAEHSRASEPDLDLILDTDRWARIRTREMAGCQREVPS